ncbi:MAG: hypothetical protein PHQ53_01790 [Candidatus Krumholzibacteria bacterium]|nr:hypothetical protein [Candidatus Krumholzibacteria bacterium]
MPRLRSCGLIPVLLPAMLLTFADPAAATSGRLRSLGGQADFLEDDANVLRWYGSLIDYPQQVVLELGDLNHDTGGSLTSRLNRQGGGLHAQFDPAGRWGTGAAYFGEDLPLPERGGWINLVWARRFGRIGMGAAFRGTSFSEAGNRNDEDLDGQSCFTHSLGLGLRWDLTSDLYADIALEASQVEVDYFNNPRGITISENGGWDNFAARGRVFHELTERLAAVYRLDWSRQERPLVDNAFDDLVDLDADIFRGGAGLNYLPDADRLLIVSVDFDRREEDRRARHPIFARYERGRRDWWRLDVRCGVEARLLPWLSVRAASRYRRTVDESLVSYDWSGGYRESTYSYAIRVETPVTVGVGLHVGPFDGDVVFNDIAPLDRGYLLTAADSGGRAPRYSAATLVYRF